MTTQHMACPSAELLKMLVFCPQSQSPASDPRKPAPDQVVKTEFLLLQPPPLFIIIFPERIAKFERRKQEKGSSKFWPLGPSLLPESASLFAGWTTSEDVVLRASQPAMPKNPKAKSLPSPPAASHSCFLRTPGQRTRVKTYPQLGPGDLSP